MTVYYTAPYDKKTRVTAFKPVRPPQALPSQLLPAANSADQGFRMIIGDPMYRSPSPDVNEFKSIAFRCFTTPWGPAPANSEIGGIYDTRTFPEKPCPYGLRINNFFPTCWDGVNVDSPSHKDHVAYPVNGTFESQEIAHLRTCSHFCLLVPFFELDSLLVHSKASNHLQNHCGDTIQ